MKKMALSLKTNVPYESEHRMVRSDGTTIWVHDRGAVVAHNDNGDAIRMVGSIADITVRKEAETTFGRNG